MKQKKNKGWINKNMTAKEDMDVGGHPVSLPEGCIGACFIWKSKAAFRRAGYTNTNAFRKVSWTKEIPMTRGKNG